MRAIFIDAVNSTVSEIQIADDLQAFYDKIGCELIQLLDLGESHSVVCDECGRLRDWPVGFRLAGPPTIAGNAIIIGTTDDGDFSDCCAPLRLFTQNVEFVDLRKNPMPSPRSVCVPIEGDLTEENIAKAKAEAE